jgi:hypothetical protein
VSGERKPFLVRPGDADIVRDAITEVVSDVINKASVSLRKVREYVDSLNAQVRACQKYPGGMCQVCVERQRIAADLSRLLPAVPPSAENHP